MLIFFMKYPNRNTIITLLFVLSFFTLLSCKGKTSTEMTTAVTADTSQNNLFDDVLGGEDISSTDIEEEQEETQITQESDIELETNVETELSYADPSCGDAICTYYETFKSCPEDCQKLEDVTLYDYPNFLEDGSLIIVGNDAPSTDVITATLIATYLVAEGISTETKLAGEVSDYDSTDMILIGNPCDNTAIANLLHYSAKNCADVVKEQNNAVIKLIVQTDNEIIILTGHDIGDTKDASEMLTDTSHQYNLNGAEEWVNLADGDINIYYSKN